MNSIDKIFGAISCKIGTFCTPSVYTFKGVCVFTVDVVLVRSCEQPFLQEYCLIWLQIHCSLVAHDCERCSHLFGEAHR